MNGNLNFLKQLSSGDFGFLKAMKREIIAAVVVMVCSLFLYKVVYQRTVREIKLIDERVESVRSETRMFNSQADARENLTRAVNEASVNLRLIEEKLKHLKERLPSDKHVSRILSEFSESDLKRGIRITSIKPLSPEDKGELARLPFQITMEARFTSFGDYLERIERLPRLMIIDNFMIEPKDEHSPELTTQLYLSAYILNYGH